MGFLASLNWAARESDALVERLRCQPTLEGTRTRFAIKYCACQLTHEGNHELAQAGGHSDDAVSLGRKGEKSEGGQITKFVGWQCVANLVTQVIQRFRIRRITEKRGGQRDKGISRFLSLPG